MSGHFFGGWCNPLYDRGIQGPSSAATDRVMPEERSTPTPRRSLRDTLDLLVALSALATSVVSIWLAVTQGDEMGRLVQAQSWPFVGFTSGNSSLDEASKQRVRSLTLSIENLGVGPAKVRSFEVLVDGRAVADHNALIRAAAGLDENVDYDQSTFYSLPVTGRVLRAGETVSFARWDRTEAVAQPWAALDQARFGRLELRVCYCSVFEECWINTLQATDPQPIAQCPVVAVPYQQ
jgi:hypothetical protein